MKLRTFVSAAEFLDVAGPTLYAGEAENSLPLGIALRVSEGHSYGPEAPFFACVEDRERLVLVALRTPPYNVLLCAETTHRQAIELLARQLAAACPALPGAQGRSEIVNAFAEAWKAETQATWSVAMEQRLYRLTKVSPPQGVTGLARWAAEDEADLLIPWGRTFVEEAVPGGPPPDVPTMIRNAIAEQRLLVWENGGVVSMCAQTRPTPHGASVGLVYTPPDLRGHGYASACVADLSQRILDSGKTFATLFADLSNPISNSIYQKIGYRPLGDFREIRFSDVAARATTA